MNRKDVVEALNDYMTEAERNVDSLDEVYKEFELWNSAVQENIKLLHSGKNVSSVPPTPGATLRFGRKLSPIRENTGGERQGDTRTSKDTGRDKSSPKHAKRTRLNFGEEDDDEILIDSSANSVEKSQNVPLVDTVGPSLQSLQENNTCDVGEERRGRRGRKTKQSSILGRKQVLPVRRNTRSNARITRSITYEIVNDCDEDLKSISKLTQENINEESAGKRERKTKHSSIVSKVHRVTSSRISRCSVKLTKIDHETSKDDRNPHNAITDACNLNIVHERNNGNEIQCGMSQNSSFERVDNDFSQDSLNVPEVTSHSLEDIGHRMKEAITTVSANSNENDSKTPNSNCKSLNDITQDSSNITTVTESVALVAAHDCTNAEFSGSKRSSRSAKSNKSITSHFAQNCVKELSVSLTRIDETWKTTLPHPLSEEFLKGVAVQSESEKRKSENVRKRSLTVITASEAQKRSNSFVDDNRSSKKSKCEEDNQEIEVQHVSENVIETSNKHQASGIRKSGRLASSKLSETNNKNHGEFVEIESFADISVSPTMVENDNIIEELSKEHDKSECHDDNLVKVNSDELEHTEYYSSVDTGEIIQTDKDEKKKSVSKKKSVPKKKSVNKGKLSAKQSLENKWEEALQVILEQNTPTPERTVSRKGGKSPALFSAYANEPVKNRVAAYEGLSTVAEELKVPSTNKRVTRTKTRAMAAAAAAAAATAVPIIGATQQKVQLNTHNHRKSGPSVKVTRASWRLKKKVITSAKKNDASKENSFQHNSSKNTDRYYKNISGTGGKILADVNGLFSPTINNSKKTPMTGPRTIPFNNLSASQISRSGCKPGVILSSVETFLKKPTKTVQDSEIKKLEEQKKREEKEREALRRREELLKKQAEEKKKKRDEIRMRVQEKREAQEKEKQESQLRVEKEKVEKWHILQQEREAKQKGNTLKKKLESERKAAEARRKLEEAEAARIAKLKMEELQHKKEQEEAEKERLRRIAEEKEAALLREKVEQNSKALAAMTKAKAENQKNNMFKLPVKVTKALDTTFTKTLDSTFTLLSTSKNSQNLDNAYNLEEIQSGDSDDDDNLPKHTARWAIKSALLQNSGLELRVSRKTCKFLSAPAINISAIFPKKLFKRTSSAIWTTPPRYSVLPKY